MQSWAGMPLVHGLAAVRALVGWLLVAALQLEQLCWCCPFVSTQTALRATGLVPGAWHGAAVPDACS